MKHAIVLFVIILTLCPVGAQSDESKCCCTTYDTSVCLSKIHEKVDKELNNTYADALKQTGDSPNDAANLKIAERKWIEFRDAACKGEYNLWGGGSGGPNAYTMCVIRLTRVRTADLKSAYLGCKPHCKQ